MSTCDPEYSGRPFGGLSVVAKSNHGLCFYEIECSCDRLLPFKVINKHGKVIQTIINVYFPFYQSGNHEQTKEFIETIDQLQTVIDDSEGVPIKIVGDFNVKLPKQAKLNQSWFRRNGFNQHSYILYDFIVANNLFVADFHFRQPVSYTYYCHTSAKYTWIDHMLFTSYDSTDVTRCSIIPQDADNVSDHLPLVMHISVTETEPSDAIPHNTRAQSWPSWKNMCNNDAYNSVLSDKLSLLPQLIKPQNSDTNYVQHRIDSYIEDINYAIPLVRQGGWVCSTKTLQS